MKKSKKGRVLIVEDDMLLSMVEERLINQLGFEVIGKVTKGIDAIEKEEKLSPDIIVMDISLKGDMDGIETMETIREKSNVPVIYLSGSGDRYSVERAKKTGFTDFLTKPVTGSDLKEPLYNAMNEHNGESENDNQVLKSA
ncbi:response regulator [Fodinibius sp. SL11]|uniref:response regulator n=1 Tax=Fodinibius sp. SL11 TaxID=3425690 RepID=UPI003F880E41